MGKPSNATISKEAAQTVLDELERGGRLDAVVQLCLRSLAAPAPAASEAPRRGRGRDNARAEGDTL